MCALPDSTWCAAAIVALGCWSIGLAGELLPCLQSRRCRRHVTCRRCLASAATRAWILGAAGLAVACGASDLWPDHPARAIFCGLVVGGLANFTRADWRQLAKATLAAALGAAIDALRQRKDRDHDD